MATSQKAIGALLRSLDGTWESELLLLAPAATLPFNAWYTRLILTWQKWGGTAPRGPRSCPR